MSADLPRLLADMEALAEGFVSEIDWSDGRNHYGDNEAWEAAARRVREVIAAHADAATDPAPGLQAGGDAASGVAQRPEPDAGDVDALADWLGGQVEAGNVTDYTDEQTTWIEVGVDDLAHRIVALDWLPVRDAAMRAQGAADALREAADEIDREAAEAAARRRVPAVRCLACDLRYEERDQYGCHEPGRPHTYDPTDLTEAGRVVVEPTYDGDRLRDRARRIAGQDGGGQ